jgi:mannosyltransferase
VSLQAAEPSPVATRYALLAIVLVAAALRLPTLGVQSLWFDEAATWGQVNDSFAEIIYRTSADNYPPLYNILAWLLVQVLGDAEWVLRLPAALLAIANVPLLYLLGRRIAGPSVGLLAAALLALSAYHVWYSQEARMYSLLAFAATAYGWAALRGLERPGLGPALLLAGSGIILVYSHPYGALTWAGIGLGALLVHVARRDWRGLGWLIGAGFASALVFLPWAIILIGRARVIETTGFWIATPTAGSVLEDLIRLTGGLVVLVLLAIPILLWRRRRLVPLRLGFAPVILVAWVTVPVVLGFIASLLFEPVFHPRYLLGTLPAWLLLYALALLALFASPRARVIAAALSLVVGIVVLVTDSPGPRADWRAMAARAQALYQPGDCVMMDVHYHRVALDYYWRDPDRCNIGGDASASLAAANAPEGRLFVIANMGKQWREVLASEIEQVLERVDAIEFRGITLYMFQRRDAGPSFDHTEQ